MYLLRIKKLKTKAEIKTIERNAKNKSEPEGQDHITNTLLV